MRGLKKLAHPNIQFVGPAIVRGSFAIFMPSCRALVFPGEEDFGIVPVEAMASGRPVIAYDKGGIRDSVRDGTSGILYPNQSVDGLLAAIARFEKEDETICTVRHRRAEPHASPRAAFREEMAKLVERKMAGLSGQRTFS